MQLLFTLIISAVSVISLAAAALTVSPGVVSPVPAFDIPVATNFNASQAREQEEACKAAGSTKIYAATRYGGGPPQTIAYSQCVPFQNQNGEKITGTVFCRSATCNFFSDKGCTSKSLNPEPSFFPPTPVPFFGIGPDGQVVGYGAFNCTSKVVTRLA